MKKKRAVHGRYCNLFDSDRDARGTAYNCLYSKLCVPCARKINATVNSNSLIAPERNERGRQPRKATGEASLDDLVKICFGRETGNI